jgi:hypothetical protein
MVIYNTYTLRNGTYRLNHNEGEFTIQNSMVVMKPNDNADFYEHPIFPGAYDMA